MRLAIVLLLTCTSCTRGFVYTDTREPLTRNFSHTPASVVGTRGYSHEVKEPLSAAGLRVEWASRAIGDIAKRGELNQIYFADLHTLSILGGVYLKKTVEVYGRNDFVEGK